jgi:hypothetical protein
MRFEQVINVLGVAKSTQRDDADQLIRCSQGAESDGRCAASEPRRIPVPCGKRSVCVNGETPSSQEDVSDDLDPENVSESHHTDIVRTCCQATWTPVDCTNCCCCIQACLFPSIAYATDCNVPIAQVCTDTLAIAIPGTPPATTPACCEGLECRRVGLNRIAQIY